MLMISFVPVVMVVACSSCYQRDFPLLRWKMSQLIMSVVRLKPFSGQEPISVVISGKMLLFYGHIKRVVPEPGPRPPTLIT